MSEITDAWMNIVGAVVFCVGIALMYFLYAGVKEGYSKACESRLDSLYTIEAESEGGEKDVFD